jgi:hypothetical protein
MAVFAGRVGPALMPRFFSASAVADAAPAATRNCRLPISDLSRFMMFSFVPDRFQLETGYPPLQS